MKIENWLRKQLIRRGWLRCPRCHRKIPHTWCNQIIWED